MIAVPQVSQAPSAQTAERHKSTFHREFLNLLPAIRRHAHICFRRLGAEAREEAIQAALAHAWVGFKRLAERDRIKAAFATPLARVRRCACVGRSRCWSAFERQRRDINRAAAAQVHRHPTTC